mmetsp:Transcript_3032/g.8987  ORF Transcript_3032/g.8987 Transcript_3032/m.8987 type:complete len:201 (-) Transcript_3032:359-961(-)
MTMPILPSGTLMLAVLAGGSTLAFSAASFTAFSFSARAAATIAAVRPASTCCDAPAAFGADDFRYSEAGAMPGMDCCAWPGFRPWAARTLASNCCSSTRAFRFSAFFVRPLETSHSPPVPSSNWTKRSGLASRFFGASSSTAFALALGLAAACFGLASAFGFAAASAFGSGAFGSAGACTCAFAFAFGCAFASAFGSAFG